MKPLPEEISAVSRDAILQQLEKVLSSAIFHGSERSIHLLRFLVDQTVNGQSARLKEYTLGAEALGRGSSFDPQTDTIVRAEVSRLRSRIEKYYATEGETDPVVMTLVRGSYVPRFQKRTLPAKAAADLGRGITSLPSRVAWFALALGAGASVFAVVVLWGLWRAPGSDNAVSIAVLPFANLSGDASQEFFSDGITEEITTVLAKISDLRVVARTSAYQFKGENKDMRAVGKALGATHLIEGSVRKAGARIRISVQLINAGDGTHIWSENYDRELTDIFAAQEDIATAIAAALKLPLGLRQGDTLVRDRTKDIESYQQYLHARALYRTRAIDEAIEILEPLIARDPNYAPGWALLARAYLISPPYVNRAIVRAGPAEQAHRVVQTALEKAEMAARKAIQLDSRQASAYSVLGFIQYLRRKWTDSEELFRQAMALDQSDPDILYGYGQMLWAAGRLRDSLSVYEELRTLEPFVPIYNVALAAVMQSTGQNAASIPILQAISPTGPTGNTRNSALAQAYAAEGRFAEAADTLRLITGNQASPKTVEDAARLLRTAPAKAAGPFPNLGARLTNFAYAYVGGPNPVLDDAEREMGVGTPATLQVWAPVNAPVRKTERFKALLRNIGLVDYWRQRGWPDLCHPTGADDFVCD